MGKQQHDGQARTRWRWMGGRLGWQEPEPRAKDEKEMRKEKRKKKRKEEKRKEKTFRTDAHK